MSESFPTDAPDTVLELPPELVDLDAELALFSAAERSSFAPELEAELRSEWNRGPRRRSGLARARRAVGATAAALILTGMAVPPARASLITGLNRLFDALQEPAAPRPAVPLPQDPALEVPAGIEMTLQAQPPRLPPGDDVRPNGAEAPDLEPAGELPAFRPSPFTYPTIADAEAEQDLIRRHYPPDLQRAGIGGTVRLLLWVAEDGSVDNVQTRSNSGVPALDRAAMQGARSLRFNPASRDGQPVGTYVEFDVVFEPIEEDWVPPSVIPVGDPELPEGFAYELPEDGPLTLAIPATIRLEAKELLGVSLGASDEAIESQFGSLDRVLAGDPPAGRNPFSWRREVARELERAMARDPENPAPVLALARIRRKQGLRAEARALYERGVERAKRGVRPVSPRLVAELKYELADIVRESWLSGADLGVLPADVLAQVACMRRPGGSGLETLIALNYVCPAELGATLAESFQPDDRGKADREAMEQLLEGAVEVFPGHVPANVAILLGVADEELWLDLLNRSRRFAWATSGHPYSFLLSGLALQRLGRSEEAMLDFTQAFGVLGDDVEAQLRDVSSLGADDGEAPADFWVGLDPILNTGVNEREVEHLARAAYAYLRFGTLDSDAARLWLRYGRPVAVRTFGTADLRTEFWDYGQGPDVTLSRPATADDRSYTPEAETYLDDLREVLPHWYGTRARSLYSLPAQTARFRGVEAGTGELEVRFEVPPALETFEGDSLDLGLHLLAADGSTLSATRRRIAGDAVRLLTLVEEAAVGAVVELYNDRTREAAAVRLTALRSRERGVDQRISDLMLVEPAAPLDRTIGRADGWVRPLARHERIAEARVGVMFELYDLPEVTSPYYRIRVEVQSETSGETRELAFRPGGQNLFGTEWTRSPAGRDGRAVEYLTLDLDGLRAGLYTLRVVVQFEEGEEIIEELNGISVLHPGTPVSAEPGLRPMRMQYD